MKDINIEQYFGTEINTVFGCCFVEGFTEDKTGVVLYENGEPFSYTIKDFINEIKEYNS